MSYPERASLLAVLICLMGCDNMDRQPKFKPLDPSSFFSDGRSARMPVTDTVPRGMLHTDRTYAPLTPALLARGRERYDIFCAVCHGRVGDGHGMVVQRGFPVPPSFHIDRLRHAPIGHFFDVMTNGFGTMYSYSDRISVEDRWAIAEYLRALQYSQNARISNLLPEDRAALEKIR